MAAITPSSVKALASGIGCSFKLASFTTSADADTWASAITGIVAVIPVDKTGTTTAGVAASFSGSTVTFNMATNGKAVDLLIITRGA